MSMLDTIKSFLLNYLPDWMVTLVIILAEVVALILPLLLSVAYLTLAERKVIGYIQIRIGPNRVGPRGLLQPIADAVKLIMKETILPSNANRFLFILGPILTIAPAMAAWAVIPFQDNMVIANLNAGLLYILAMTSLGVYGVIIAGWASNSKYAFLGALRSAAQIVSYEIAMGFAIVGVLLAAGSLNIGEIVQQQRGTMVNWFIVPLLPLFMVYLISGVAETNRAPFDVAEGESEIVAGFHVEYSAMTFGVFFLAEYANMVLISVLTSLMFIGGWLSPLHGLLPQTAFDLPFVGLLLGDGIHWLLAKTAFFLFFFLWIRATFPRYRYDQIMRLGWKVFIPITIVWLMVVGWAVVSHVGPWFSVTGSV